MKLKTDNAAKKSFKGKKNKSPKKQGKGVEVRKDKSKVVVKPTVLKKESDKAKVVEMPTNPQKILQRELWNKAIVNVSNKTGLSDVESCIVKLLADYKTKNSIPMRSIKFKNFISKGFSKYKDTSDDVLDGVYNKISNEFKVVGGKPESIADSTVSSKKSDSKVVKTKPTKVAANDEEDDDDDDDDDEEVDDDDDDEMADDDEVDDDEAESGDDIEDMEDESEEEKPKPKAKGGNKANNKNGKSPNKGKNGKFKGGKVQKNKKFGKKN